MHNTSKATLLTANLFACLSQLSLQDHLIMFDIPMIPVYALTQLLYNILANRPSGVSG